MLFDHAGHFALKEPEEWAMEVGKRMIELRATTLVDGLWFPEGPRWHEDRLWFSDVLAQW